MKLNYLLFAFLIAILIIEKTFGQEEKSISQSAIATLHLKGYPDFLVADKDGVWVTNENRVEKLVFGKPEPVITISMPNPCGAMAVGFKSLWVASCENHSIYRINLLSGKIEAIIQTGLADLEGELSIATGAGSIWLLSKKEGELSRINPNSNKVISRIKVLPESFVVVFGFGSVWITNSKNSSVQRIDAATEKVIATISVGKTPRFLAAGLGGVWTLNQADGTISKINPQTNKVTSISANLIGTGGDIAVGKKYVYIRAKSTMLTVVNPKTNQILSRFGPNAGSGAVRVENGHVWITAHDIGTVWVIKE